MGSSTATDGVTGSDDAAPRPVSRGVNIQVGFIGIDSLYLVLEYPHQDVFERYLQAIPDRFDRRLNEGIPYEDDFLIRRGALGYGLSVWHGDARLFLTDRVEDVLSGTAAAGQGMGAMLQLGPKWLRLYGEVIDGALSRNIHAQFAVFGIADSERYPVRLNRIDMTLDLVGIDVGSFSFDEWNENWVGRAKKKDFHVSSKTGRLQGLSIRSSEGAVRFKVYDNGRQI